MFGLKVDSAVDLTGSNISHLKVNENRTFGNDAGKRIFMPDEGVFYTDSLKVYSATTNVLLEQGRDYEVRHIDPVVTEMAGREVCGAVVVTNSALTGVNFTYQFVGGMFASGLGILKSLMEQYPNGIEAIIRWTNILDKPQLFNPAYHMHHIRDFYGTDQLLVYLERVRAAVTSADRSKYEVLFKLAQDSYDRISLSLDGLETTLTTLITTTAKMLEVGEGEFIYTDNPNDPATYKNYGTWTRHANIMLMGGPEGSDGQGITLSSGTDVQARYTYVFQRTDGQMVRSYSLAANKASPINEGDTIKFNLSTNNVQANTQLAWILVGADDLDINVGRTGLFTLNSLGQASVSVTFLKDKRTEGTKRYRFQLKNYPSIGVDFDVIDTSKHVYTEAYFSSDALGINEIKTTNEPSSIYLNLKTYNVEAGTRIYLDWSTGSLTSEGTQNALPASVVVPSDGINRLNIVIKADRLTTGDRFAVVKIRSSTAIDADDYGQAACVVADTSRRPILSLRWTSDVDGLNVVSSVNEGGTVYLHATGQYFNNPEVLRLVHGGNVVSAKFVTLPNTLTLNNGLGVAKFVLANDYTTTSGTQTYGVSVTDATGDQFANTTIKVNDTSKTTALSAFFAADPAALATNALTKLNENTDYYFIIETPILPETPDLNFNYDLAGVTNLTTVRNFFSSYLPSTVPFGPAANNETGLSFVESNGKARLTVLIRTKENKVVNGDQAFTIKVVTAIAPAGVTKAVTIKDTSYPDFNIWWAKSPTGTAVATEIDEISDGSVSNTAYLVVDTAGIPVGEAITISYSGAAAAGFSEPFTTSFTATGGEIRTKVTAIPNYATDGVRTLKAKFMFRGIARNESDLIIRDGSRALNVTSVFMSNSQARTPVTQMSEGVTGAYFHFDFDEAPAGATLNWQVINNDFTNANLTPLSGTLNISRGATTAMVAFNTLADKLTSGNKTFQVQAQIAVASANKTSAWKKSSTLTLMDTSKTVGFSLGYYTTSSATTAMGSSVNEGAVMYLVAKVTNPPPGAQIKFSLPLTGAGYADNNDLQIGKITNTWLDLPANGIYVLPMTLDQSPTTEGQETLAVDAQLSTGETSNRASIVINDTAKTFGIASSFVAADKLTTITSASEGDIFYFKAVYSNAVAGQKVRVIKSATLATTMVDASDYDTNQLLAEQTIATSGDGTLYWQFKAKQDRSTDGNKTLGIDVENLTTGLKYTGKQISVVDSSKTFAVDHVQWVTAQTTTASAVTSVNEGTNVWLRVKVAAPVITGDVLMVELVNTNLTTIGATMDLVNRTVGSDGYVYWPVTIAADRKTEGNQTLSVKVTNTTTNQLIGNYTLTILDTSKEPVHVATWRSSNSSSSATVTSVNEGSDAYLHLAITNDQLNDLYEIELISGTGYVTTSDISLSLVDVKSTGAGALSWKVSALANRVTNSGTRNIGVRITCTPVSGTKKTVGSFTLPINDTSKTVAYSGGYRTSGTSTTNLTSVDEGSSFSLVVNITDGDPNDLYQAQIQTGTNLITAPKLDFSLTGQYKAINGNQLVWPITVNTDNRTQATRESLSIKVVNVTTGQAVGIYTIGINDTSKDPVATYSVRFSDRANASTTLNPAQVDEGGTAYLVIEGENIPNGTQVKLTANNSTHIPSDLGVVRTINNNVCVVPLPIGTDYTTTGDFNIRFNVLLNSTNSQVASGTLTVRDTSKTPSFAFVEWQHPDGTKVNYNPSVLDTGLADGFYMNSTYYAKIKVTNPPVSRTLTMSGDSPIATKSVSIDASGFALVPLTLGYVATELTSGVKQIAYKLSYNGGDVLTGNIYISFKHTTTTLGYQQVAAVGAISGFPSSIMLHPGEAIELEIVGGGAAGASIYSPGANSSTGYADRLRDMIGGTSMVRYNRGNVDVMMAEGGATGSTTGRTLGYGGVARASSGTVGTSTYWDLVVTLIAKSDGNSGAGQAPGSGFAVNGQAYGTGGKGESGYGGGGGGAYIRARIEYRLKANASGKNLGPIYISTATGIAGWSVKVNPNTADNALAGIVWSRGITKL